MTETAGERLKRSTQAFLDSGGDPDTAVICKIMRNGNERRLGEVLAKVTFIDDKGVDTIHGDHFTYDELATMECKIHMQLKRGAE